MIWLELGIVLLAIFMGARIGGVAIGFAGGLGVLALAAIGVEPGHIPWDVILIIMAVISAIAAMQVAGGMDYLVNHAERLLRRHPTHISLLAPLVTYFMTLLAGTGHTAFSTLPVIAQVAKEQGIRPSRPLSISVIASQIAITASPVSAAMVYFSSLLEPQGVGYLTVIFICFCSTLSAVILTALVTQFLGCELKDDPVYLERLRLGEVAQRQTENNCDQPYARQSLFIFCGAIALIMIYATALSPAVGLIADPVLSRDHAIIAIMLTAALLITWVCKIDADKISSAATFKSGMCACICVMGVAWLGATFVEANLAHIQASASQFLNQYPWMLALALFFAAMLLYSQAATTKALMPAALALGVNPITAIASFAAVSALFVLPTYPTLLAAVEMDDTGTTRIGKAVFNHPFMIPGLLAISLSVAFGFMLGHLIL
ncbi:anaerobic C4-dicarboxylate transporter [Shewanella sp. NIFS-20-20]|uniref:anaerobic C4-dicarboxylate transporter n=1 Tax=Shewanella sp. NIFS-20-20 TaxID=2853806 RepID=UPI001C464F36|nr:anaerobic C4-dicarboxylate transporter [Shewanella sp. NIFS-20-20]MBV7314341.1 anaerobic C4-dicarboxylate transporter [Shewanella sp. NIFS-20-20]